MKVKDLIKGLQSLNQDADIYYAEGESKGVRYCYINEVRKSNWGYLLVGMVNSTLNNQTVFVKDLHK